VRQAKAILAITEDDVFNLSVGLLAKQINPGIRSIIRVFDGYLAEKLKDRLRIDQVYSISAAAAPHFAAAVYEHNPATSFVWGDYLAWIGPCEKPEGEIPIPHDKAIRIPLRAGIGDGIRPSHRITLLPMDSWDGHQEGLPD